MLERAGLTERRRLRKHCESGRLASGVKAKGPNEVWSVDFKGWWKDAAGLRVEPLTIRDEYSRMILEMRALEDARGQTVRACFERLFERHGLPGAIRSDNGVPFASANSLLGLTRLSAWCWRSASIWSAAALAARKTTEPMSECTATSTANCRPDASAGTSTPSSSGGTSSTPNARMKPLPCAYPPKSTNPSERSYTGTPEDIDYDTMDTRLVNQKNGCIRLHGEPLLLSTALGGWSVGLAPTQDDLIDVWFAHLPIGQINPKTASFQAARSGGLKTRPTHSNV